MGVFELLIIIACLVLGAAFVIWVIKYFAPEPVPDYIIKLIWGLVILVIVYLILSAVGILSHDVQIPRLR